MYDRENLAAIYIYLFIGLDSIFYTNNNTTVSCVFLLPCYMDFAFSLFYVKLFQIFFLLLHQHSEIKFV